jgi:hypothetical protein
MKFIFSKAGLAFILVTFVAVWFGGGLMNQSIQIQSNTKQKTETSGIQSLNESKDPSPAIVQWIVKTSQPIANELRVSLNSWWEGQKVTLANQLIQWLTQQQQSITSDIQIQLSEMINNALKVNSTIPQ